LPSEQLDEFLANVSWDVCRTGAGYELLSYPLSLHYDLLSLELYRFSLIILGCFPPDILSKWCIQLCQCSLSLATGHHNKGCENIHALFHNIFIGYFFIHIAVKHYVYMPECCHLVAIYCIICWTLDCFFIISSCFRETTLSATENLCIRPQLVLYRDNTLELQTTISSASADATQR